MTKTTTGGIAVLAVLGALCLAVPASLAGPAPDDDGASPPVAARRIDDPLLTERLAGPPGGYTEARRTTAVELTVSGDEVQVGAALEGLGGRVTGEVPGRIVQADVPAARLAELARIPGVVTVRAPRLMSLRPRPGDHASAGPVLAEAAALTNAAAWQAAGQTGAGIKVGIIDYFNGVSWSAAAARGELPNPIGTYCVDSASLGTCGPGGSVFDPTDDGHGNAVAEVIHDLAPGALLYLARGASISDLYAVVDWFAANGVRIINRSLGSPYDGPGDGTGALDSLADYAAAKGITWVNAAGNEGYEQYWRGTWNDPDGDGWLDFTPGEEALQISTATSGGCLDVLGLRWSDWGAAASRTNYDVYIYEGDTLAYPLGGAPDQRAGAPPIELDGVSNSGPGGCSPLYRPNIRVRLNGAGSGTRGDVLELLLYAGSLGHWQAPGSAGTGIVDSRNRAVVAVGAIDPPEGAAIGYYSSQGPTNDGRRKPDLSASSGLSTSVFGSRGFAGTSAAAPTATGIAALLLGANRAATAQGLAALLKHSVVDRGIPGPDNVYGTGELRLGLPPAPVLAPGPAAFSALTPSRLLDTRTSTTVPGPLEAEQIVDLPIAGVGAVPADATAVALNVTVDQATTGGYVQVLPTGMAPIDGSSNLNVETTGQTVPNFVITPVGTGGSVSFYAPSGGQLIVDILGYYRPSGPVGAGRTIPLAPTRVLDTRQAGGSKPRPGSSTTVSFPAGSGLPASGASAVILTVTGNEPSGTGYVTAYPSGTALPEASVLNLSPGGAYANAVIVPLGADGTVSLYSSAGAHLIVDLAGYVTDATAAPSASGLFVPVSPARIVDTRAGTAYRSGEVRPVQIGGAGGIPAGGVAAVAFNFTATQTAAGNGYLQVWPGDVASAAVSNLNWSRAGQTIAAGGIVKLSAAGGVWTHTEQGTHLLIDVFGYFRS